MASQQLKRSPTQASPQSFHNSAGQGIGLGVSAGSVRATMMSTVKLMIPLKEHLRIQITEIFSKRGTCLDFQALDYLALASLV